MLIDDFNYLLFALEKVEGQFWRDHSNYFMKFSLYLAFTCSFKIPPNKEFLTLCNSALQDERIGENIKCRINRLLESYLKTSAKQSLIWKNGNHAVVPSNSEPVLRNTLRLSNILP